MAPAMAASPAVPRLPGASPFPQDPTACSPGSPAGSSSRPGPQGGQGVLAATSAAARLIASAPLESSGRRGRRSLPDGARCSLERR